MVRCYAGFPLGGFFRTQRSGCCLLFFHCLFLTIVASSHSATHVLESRIDFNFSAASYGTNQSHCSKALTHDISIPRERKGKAKTVLKIF